MPTRVIKIRYQIVLISYILRKEQTNSQQFSLPLLTWTGLFELPWWVTSTWRDWRHFGYILSLTLSCFCFIGVFQAIFFLCWWHFSSSCKGKGKGKARAFIICWNLRFLMSAMEPYVLNNKLVYIILERIRPMWGWPKIEKRRRSVFQRFGYKAILYLQHCFKQRTFPQDKEMHKVLSFLLPYVLHL